jgi:hypothetical protein
MPIHDEPEILPTATTLHAVVAVPGQYSFSFLLLAALVDAFLLVFELLLQARFSTVLIFLADKRSNSLALLLRVADFDRNAVAFVLLAPQLFAQLFADAPPHFVVSPPAASSFLLDSSKRICSAHLFSSDDHLFRPALNPLPIAGNCCFKRKQRNTIYDVDRPKCRTAQ